MNTLHCVYRPSLALLTDLYQLTMAYGYWKEAGYPRSGSADREAVFHLTFRRNPFGGGFTIAAGLATAVEYLQQSRFTADDTAYLAGLTGNDGRPLFEPAFLDFLRGMEPACDIDAVPEGTVVFPQEPLVRVRGPLLQAQLLETALLNIINFQTLIATKAARLVLAAQGEPVLEFGLRRAQGIDGALFRQPRRLHRRLRGHLERPRRAALRHSRPRHPRPQLGHVPRRRADRLPRVRPRDAQQLRLPRRYL